MKRRKRKIKPERRKGPDYARRAKQTPVTRVIPIVTRKRERVFAIYPTIAKPFLGTVIPFYLDNEGSSILYTDKKGRRKKVTRPKRLD